MSRKFKIRDQEAVHFVTFTIVQWLDVSEGAEEYRIICAFIFFFALIWF